jgi:putative sterol carrier protein
VNADSATSLVDALAAASLKAPSGVRELFAALDQAGVETLYGDERASIGFRLGPAGDWLVEVGDGTARVEEGFDTADCIIETSEETLLAILRGEQNPRTARMAGKVRVSGNFEIASQLSRMAQERGMKRSSVRRPRRPRDAPCTRP